MPQGPTSFGALATKGDSTVGRDLTVKRNLTIVGTLTPAGNQAVAGNQTVSGNQIVSGFIQGSQAIGLTAVGTNRATALALTKQANIVATAASTAVGVVLPAASVVGVGGYVDVYNDGPSNSFHVYAAGSDTIDGTAGSTGVALTNAFMSRYVVSATGAFVSYRFPIVRSA